MRIFKYTSMALLGTGLTCWSLSHSSPPVVADDAQAAETSQQALRKALGPDDMETFCSVMALTNYIGTDEAHQRQIRRDGDDVLKHLEAWGKADREQDATGVASEKRQVATACAHFRASVKDAGLERTKRTAP
jgi:hypothetical protein